MNSSAYQVGATNQVKCDISYMPRKILGEKSSIAVWTYPLILRNDVLNSSLTSTDNIQTKLFIKKISFSKDTRVILRVCAHFPCKSAIISSIWKVAVNRMLYTLTSASCHSSCCQKQSITFLMLMHHRMEVLVCRWTACKNVINFTRSHVAVSDLTILFPESCWLFVSVQWASVEDGQLSPVKLLTAM